jgi:hypothetical protein
VALAEVAVALTGAAVEVAGRAAAVEERPAVVSSRARRVAHLRMDVPFTDGKTTLSSVRKASYRRAGRTVNPLAGKAR